MIEKLLENMFKEDLNKNLKPISIIGELDGFKIYVPNTDEGADRLIKMIDFSQEVYDIETFPKQELYPSNLEDEKVFFGVKGSKVIPIKVYTDEDYISVYTGQPDDIDNMKQANMLKDYFMEIS